jgi:hypothetical protein
LTSGCGLLPNSRFRAAALYAVNCARSEQRIVQSSHLTFREQGLGDVIAMGISKGGKCDGL